MERQNLNLMPGEATLQHLQQPRDGRDSNLREEPETTNVLPTSLPSNIIVQQPNFHRPPAPVSIQQAARPGSRALLPGGREITFACGFCDRRFSTWQALGGHQNRHKEERRKLLGGDEKPVQQATLALQAGGTRVESSDGTFSQISSPSGTSPGDAVVSSAVGQSARWHYLGGSAGISSRSGESPSRLSGGEAHGPETSPLKREPSQPKGTSSLPKLTWNDPSPYSELLGTLASMEAPRPIPEGTNGVGVKELPVAPQVPNRFAGGVLSAAPLSALSSFIAVMQSRSHDSDSPMSSSGKVQMAAPQFPEQKANDMEVCSSLSPQLQTKRSKRERSPAGSRNDDEAPKKRDSRGAFKSINPTPGNNEKANLVQAVGHEREINVKSTHFPSTLNAVTAPNTRMPRRDVLGWPADVAPKGQKRGAAHGCSGVVQGNEDSATDLPLAKFSFRPSGQPPEQQKTSSTSQAPSTAHAKPTLLSAKYEHESAAGNSSNPWDAGQAYGLSHWGQMKAMNLQLCDHDGQVPIVKSILHPWLHPSMPEVGTSVASASANSAKPAGGGAREAGYDSVPGGNWDPAGVYGLSNWAPSNTCLVQEDVDRPPVIRSTLLPDFPGSRLSTNQPSLTGPAGATSTHALQEAVPFLWTANVAPGKDQEGEGRGRAPQASKGAVDLNLRLGL